MSGTEAGLQRKIESARDLQSVVRTMKALAASSIGQYERSVRALADYDRTVSLGLGACLRSEGSRGLGPPAGATPRGGVLGAVVFGSDQGLVGRFNEVVTDHAAAALAAAPGDTRVWAVGERVHARLVDAGLHPLRCFVVPSSAQAIIPLVAEILVESEKARDGSGVTALHLFHNRPGVGAAYAPVGRRLLPLDDAWRDEAACVPWPTGTSPEVMGGVVATLRALIREHLFISLFRACAESLASENASRLAAMERADRNIDEVLAGLQETSHRLRQNGIDEELFDVIAGSEALTTP